jgi:hypothetical protein
MPAWRARGGVTGLPGPNSGCPCLRAVDGVLAAYKKEGFALAATARAVELVERAIRGETFAPKL